jgi:hypothetical protein
LTNNNFTPPADLGRLQNVSVGIGLVGILAWIIGAAVLSGNGKNTFFQTYLVAFIFWTSVALGCLGLLMVQYLGGASWGLLIRRQLEAGAHTLWLMLILFLPIAIVGLPSLYPWAQPLDRFPEAEQRLIEHRSSWLNQRAFLIRGVIYFIVWIGLAAYLRKWSKRQDENRDMGGVQRAQNLSGPGFVLYGIAVTFAGVDWVMSLDPEWFSTIFGLLMLIGQGVLALAFLITIGVYLSAREPMDRVYQSKHFHDLGKLLLAAVMVWAYFSFSQLLIIWSGNLPEEIPWYLERFKGQWRWLGVALILLNFALPFMLLLSRDLKHNRRRLMAVAWLLIAMRFVDLLWLIAPEFESGHAGEARHYGLSVANYINYAAAVIGVGGFWLGWFFYQLRQRALVPHNDPQLREVLARGEHLLSFEGY